MFIAGRKGFQFGLIYQTPWDRYPLLPPVYVVKTCEAYDGRSICGCSYFYKDCLRIKGRRKYMSENKDLIFDIYEKVTGLSDLDWAEIRIKHGLDCHPETLRKAGVGIKMASEAGVLNFDEASTEAYADLYKAKKQFYDQRREYNKLLTDEARNDHIANELIKCANELSKVKPLCVSDGPIDLYPGKDEAVLILSDWHYGLTTDNVWNIYNTDIADRRIAYVVSRTINKLKEHPVGTLHVMILGDMISGCIHNSIAVKNSEDVVDQIMHVSERLAEVISELSMHVPVVYVHSTYGNHARTVQKFENSIHSDNLERLIPFWLKVRIQSENVIFDGDNYHELIGTKVCGYGVCAVHGDLENTKDAPLILYKLYEKGFGGKMQYLLTGHLHSTSFDETLGIHKIQVSSLCGSDEYAKNKRLFSLPAQTLLFFNYDGLDSIHNIVLDKV